MPLRPLSERAARLAGTGSEITMKTMQTIEFGSGFCHECGADINNTMDWLIWLGMCWERSVRALENAETATEFDEVLAWQADLNAQIQTYKTAIKVHCTTF